MGRNIRVRQKTAHSKAAHPFLSPPRPANRHKTPNCGETRPPSEQMTAIRAGTIQPRGLTVKKTLLALLVAPSVLCAAEPFLIFAADAAYTDTAAVSVAKKYFLIQDYLGYGAVLSRPELTNIVPVSHEVAISPDLADLSRKVQLGCGPQSPSVVFYQNGQAASEIVDPLGSISRAAALVHAGCQRFGLLPETQIFVVTNCAVNLKASLYRSVDWSAIDFLDIGGASYWRTGVLAGAPSVAMWPS